MDRIDLRIEVPAVTAADLILPPPAEGSAEVAARVAAARDIQRARYAAAGLPQVRTNAEAPAAVLEAIAQPDAQGTKLLRDAAETMRLSARGYHRVLRVARTLGRSRRRRQASAGCIWPKRCPTARWPRISGARRNTPRPSRPRQPAGNEFCLRSANHKPRVLAGLVERVWRVMLRFKVLVSAVPLALAAVSRASS